MESSEAAKALVVEELGKTYRVSDKAPGFKNTIAHFIKRKTRDVHAVRGASFSLNVGESVGFLGENGAGKTTTLKMLSGLIAPSSGKARVLGFEPFKRNRTFLKNITLVMGGKQQLIWDLPALDSYKIHAAVYGLEEKAAERKVSMLAEMLRVEGFLSVPVRKLSLGQRMKAELVAALLHSPKVLFLDEPTLGLDFSAQALIRTFLKEYNEKEGATLLLTSHYMADILALSQRVIVMHQGRLIFDDALDVLRKSAAEDREIHAEFSHEVEAKTLVEKFGKDVSRVQMNGERKTIIDVSGSKSLAVVRTLSSHFPLVDLSIKEAPVEKVVQRLFSEHEKLRRKENDHAL